VTPLEQVLRCCLEAFGAEHFEAEGVGEPVGLLNATQTASASSTCCRETRADSTARMFSAICSKLRNVVGLVSMRHARIRNECTKFCGELIA
jgi:hypothetical protein